MDKQTEEKIKKIINEAIDETLNEISISAKRRNEKNAINTFKKGVAGYNGIRTFGIVSAENPNSIEVSKKINRRLTKTLARVLSDAHYAFVKQRGHFGGNDELSYFIFNIKLPTLKYYAGLYEQTSFFYCYMENSKVISEYWQKARNGEPYDEKSNPYVMLEKTDNWLDASSEEQYSIIGNRFKYTIPLKIFENVNNVINVNSKKFINEDFEDVLMMASDCVGETAWNYRNKLYKGLF